MSKKILVVYSNLKTGAGERSLVNLVNALAEQEYEVYLQLFDGRGFLFKSISKKVTVLPFLLQYAKYSEELMCELRAKGLGWMADIREFVHARNGTPEFMNMPIGSVHEANWQELKKMCPEYTGYDVAIAFANTLMLKIVAEKCDSKKKIAFVHTDLKSRMAYRMDNSIFSQSFFEHEEKYWSAVDRIVTCSQQNMDSFIECYPSLKEKVIPIQAVHNRKYLEAMSDSFMPQEYLPDKANIFTSARIIGEKGIDLLLNAAAILKRVGINFRWVIAGNTNSNVVYRDEVFNLHRELGLEQSVIFTSNISNPFPYYKHCNLYVHTSRVEGRPLALDEAKILGCAILSTRFPSVSDSITDGETGILCDINPQNIADGVIRLIENPELRKKLSAACVNEIDDELVISKYKALLDG